MVITFRMVRRVNKNNDVFDARLVIYFSCGCRHAMKVTEFYCAGQGRSLFIVLSHCHDRLKHDSKSQSDEMDLLFNRFRFQFLSGIGLYKEGKRKYY